MLSFQYIPYREHSSLNTDEKLKKILRITKQNKIILMQGKLKPNEEAKLIEEANKLRSIRKKLCWDFLLFYKSKSKWKRRKKILREI